MPKRIKAKCPACGKALCIPFYRVATYIGTRTCSCGLRWRVKAEALEIGRSKKAWVHTITFTAV